MILYFSHINIFISEKDWITLQAIFTYDFFGLNVYLTELWFVLFVCLFLNSIYVIVFWTAEHLPMNQVKKPICYFLFIWFCDCWLKSRFQNCFDFDWTFALNLQNKISCYILLYIDIEPKYHRIWFLVHIAQPKHFGLLRRCLKVQSIYHLPPH